MSLVHRSVGSACVFFVFWVSNFGEKKKNLSSCPETDLKYVGGDTRIDFIQPYINELPFSETITNLLM